MTEMVTRPRGDKRCPKCGSTRIQSDWEREVGTIHSCMDCGFSKGFDASPFYQASKRYYTEASE